MKDFNLKTIELEISNPCNERCVHCYRSDKNASKGFLSLGDAEKILREAKELGAVNCTVTGGEALLNPEWHEILKCADGLNYRTSLFTNATLLNEADADFLAAIRNLHEVQISLYAMDAATHEAVTKVQGSFAKTFDAIKLLRSRNIPIFISCPAMQTNKHAVADVMRWADTENIGSCVDLFIFGSSDGGNLHERWTDSDMESFFDITMKDSGALSYVWGRENERPDLEKTFFHGGTKLCVNGIGDIFPSIGWYDLLGSIKETSLRKVASSEKFDRIANIKAGDFSECRECEAADRCSFCPSPHVSAHGLEFRKLDEASCAHVKLCKKYMERRNQQLAR